MRKYLCAVLFFFVLLTGCSDNAENGAEKKVSYSAAEDISADLRSAEAKYASGEYKDALLLFLDLEKKDIRNIEPRLGAAKCQMEMGNYDVAQKDLEFILSLYPRDSRIYDSLLELNKKKDNMFESQKVIALAEKNHVTEFLEKVPGTPELNLQDGAVYGFGQDIVISGDPNEQIYFTERNPDLRFDVVNRKYTVPVHLFHGQNTIESYCVKDGIPGETVSITVNCDYEPFPIVFKDDSVEKAVREKLSIPEGDITDRDCEAIDYLDLYYSDYSENSSVCKRLDDLEYMPNLNSLFLGGQEISDYSPLSRCVGLQSLYIQNCGIEEIGFVNDIGGLTSLGLQNNNITDFSPVLKNEKLYRVETYQNPCKDVSCLLEHPDLSGIGFDAGTISDYKKLAAAEKISEVTVCIEEDFDLSVFPEEFDRLQSLFFYYSETVYDKYDYQDPYRPGVMNLEVLQNYKNLKTLELVGIKSIEDIRILGTMKNLTYLYLYESPITHEPDAMEELRSMLPNCNIQC